MVVGRQFFSYWGRVIFRGNLALNCRSFPQISSISQISHAVKDVITEGSALFLGVGMAFGMVGPSSFYDDTW